MSLTFDLTFHISLLLLCRNIPLFIAELPTKHHHWTFLDKVIGKIAFLDQVDWPLNHGGSGPRSNQFIYTSRSILRPCMIQIHLGLLQTDSWTTWKLNASGTITYQRHNNLHMGVDGVNRWVFKLQLTWGWIGSVKLCSHSSLPEGG